MKTANDKLNEHGITGKFRFHNEDGTEMSRHDIIYAMEEYASDRIKEVVDKSHALMKEAFDTVETIIKTGYGK